MNRLTFPMRYLRITQNYNGNVSHAKHVTGSPIDYPIDAAGLDSGRDYFFCPCDDMQVYRIYGTKNAKKSNTIWLVSRDKVNFANGITDYCTIMVTHENDDDLLKISTNARFKRGVALFREGADGNATGNHLHIAVGIGTPTNNGWIQNSKGAWVLTTTGGPIKPELAFFVDEAFTTINNSGSLNWIKLPKNPYPRPTHQLCYKTHHIAAGRSPSEEVKWVQFELTRLGFYASNIDGWFGPMTDAAVRKAQTKYRGTTYIDTSGLRRNKIDGSVGPLTIHMLEVSKWTQH